MHPVTSLQVICGSRRRADEGVGRLWGQEAMGTEGAWGGGEQAGEQMGVKREEMGIQRQEARGAQKKVGDDHQRGQRESEATERWGEG